MPRSTEGVQVYEETWTDHDPELIPMEDRVRSVLIWGYILLMICCCEVFC